MNTTLFKSCWALTGILISAGFVVWMVLIGAAPGARTTPKEVDLLLWSGWVTFGLMAGVCLYSLRKYVHKLGISPEFKMRAPAQKLEEADRLMNDLRRRILLGQITSVAEAARSAQQILKETRVHKVCRAVAREASGPGPKFVIGVLPTEPLGRMKKWLHFHVYLGLASGVTLYVHGGATLATPIGAMMNILTALVLLTGVIGTILFAIGPRLMTRAEKDMNFEDAFVLEQSLKLKIAAAYAALKPEQAKAFRKAEKAESTMAIAKTGLQSMALVDEKDKRGLEDIMVLITQRRRILDDLRGAARIKFLINIWRAVHLPASILLLGVAVVHIVSVIWY